MNQSSLGGGGRTGVNVSHGVSIAQLPDSNSALDGSVATASTSNAPTVLFDDEVPVHVKQLDREEVYQPLGICVSVGRGGPTGISKCVVVRLTDPKDPFFLFSMTLLEDDYGRFKEKHELMVDFNGFPRDLVQMLGSIGSGSTNIITFVADSKESCVLRILERTEFRALEHIALNMSRQGDIGQKKYLAERFQFFLAAFHRSEQERKEEVRRYERLLEECRGEVRQVTSERDELLEHTRRDATIAASNQIAATSALKDQHASELKQLRAVADETRAELTRKLDAAAAQHSAEARQKEAELAALRTSLANAESAANDLSSQLRIAKDKMASLTNEAEHLRKENDSLSSFRHTATQRISEFELQQVSHTERIRHLTETLSSKEEDLKALRETQMNQDGYSKMLSSQLAALQEKVAASETSLSKAHHILGSQVQALRSSKEKYAALKGQLDANETLIGEKNNLIERLRGDLLNSGDKIELLQGKVTALKDQLAKAEDQNSKLTVQLKQNEDALVHMQRMSTTFGSRTFGLSSTPSFGLPPTQTQSSAGGGLKMPTGVSLAGASLDTATLYRQFAAGMTGGQPTPAPSAGGVAAMVGGSSSVVSSGGTNFLSNLSPQQEEKNVDRKSGIGSLPLQNQLLGAIGGLSSTTATTKGPEGNMSSTYPYTSNSPSRIPLTPSFGFSASSAPLYGAPKPGLIAGDFPSEKPSSYFGN